jgi:hypothetical protein
MDHQTGVGSTSCQPQVFLGTKPASTNHDATAVLMEDDPTLNTFSSTGDTRDENEVVLDGVGDWCWITVAAVQDKIFCSTIKFYALG